MAVSSGYLLDTNILVYLIRGGTLGNAISSNFGLVGSLNRCIISVVTVGEMYSLAFRWKWGAKKTGQLHSLLGQLVCTDINHPDILDAYGEIDHFSTSTGHKMGKNDVWIAATAKVAQFEILTADSDFDHLHIVHLNRTKVDIKTGAAIP